MTLHETDLNERLDEMDIFEASHDSGVYALEVDAPSEPTVAKERWDQHHDKRPPEDTLTRVAAAEDVYYVGAASNVYRRLTEHISGDVRRATFLEAFPPIALERIWLTGTDPTKAEFNTAVKLAQRDGTVAWSDGVLRG